MVQVNKLDKKHVNLKIKLKLIFCKNLSKKILNNLM